MATKVVATNTCHLVGKRFDSCKTPDSRSNLDCPFSPVQIQRKQICVQQCLCNQTKQGHYHLNLS